ncbi:MAG: hypothetical protein M1834_003958 [Cirrosporium novae-zelandiae]|nr:MAG: hypothetical protein M1834_003958 [Cirrosporium novae-zelandiae]
MLSTLLLLAGANLALGATYSSRPPESTVEPATTAIDATAATATPLSPVSNVKGLAFDRFIQIWLENIDYSSASGNVNQKYFASQGITLSNFFATTHPSEPNYCAAAGGDNFGMDNDDFNTVPANISTVADLLDTKGISWGEYQEHMPYPGFEGFNYSNQVNFANDYVRKHNPLIFYDSVTQNKTRLSMIKNFTNFWDDLENKKLPQWSFMTPNMTNDGHDTTITYASKWERAFLDRLLNNTYFMNNTLLLLTFDEDETYSRHNRIFSVLLGGAVPDHLKGTTDDTFYNHYSSLSTVEANWGLPSLGRWDCNANIFKLVSNKTGYVNYDVDTTHLYFNESYPGPLSDDLYDPEWPVPLTSAKCAAGNGILQVVKDTYSGMSATMNYTNPYPYDAASGNNVGGSATRENATATASSTSAAGSASSSSGAGSSNTFPKSLAIVLGAVGVFLT